MGRLIVIDGLDGSGKGTQTELLCRALTAQNRRVRMISFPAYGTPGAAAAEYYLGGGLGSDPADTGPYAASSFFAIDRYISWRHDWGAFLSEPDTVVLANRYTTANAVHQLSKMDPAQWDAFLGWLWDFEFDKLGLPKPDLVLYLEMTPAISRQLVKKRSADTGQKMDIHETASDHLENSYRAALFAARKLGWHRICCYENGMPKPIALIAAEILEIVSGALDAPERT